MNNEDEATRAANNKLIANIIHETLEDKDDLNDAIATREPKSTLEYFILSLKGYRPMNSILSEGRTILMKEIILNEQQSFSISSFMASITSVLEHIDG